jgi:hypothetical protein
MGILIKPTHRESRHKRIREVALEPLNLCPKRPPSRPLADVDDDGRRDLMPTPAGDLFEQLH